MFSKHFSNHAASRLIQILSTVLICLSLGANTHVDAANTLRITPNVPATPVTNTAPMGNGLAKNMQVLSPKDADLYRIAFLAHQKSDWKSADIAISNLTDKRLLGHVLADRYQRRTPSLVEMKEWLINYGNLPEADDMYEMARKMPGAKKVKLTPPTLSDTWSGSDRYGTSYAFKIDDNDDSKPSQAAKNFSAKIDRTLRKGDPHAAKVLLETEQKRRHLPANEVADIKGRIATSFYYEGETDHARKLASEAATPSNPRTLWIKGMAAWKQNDMQAAAQTFSSLATIRGLSSWDRAAAQFWAYRALKRKGDIQQSHYWLEQAALQPRSFYGFIATHLLSREVGWSWKLPELSAGNVAILASRPAGWRTLALLQIGQPALAEEELRHLNPQGRKDLQEAMLALAEKTRMPSLTLHLGGIATANNGKLYDAALYPVPPWQPMDGFKIDRALMYALIRHESRFNPTAVSGRGACGLMQLMPTTASLVAGSDVETCSGRMLNPAYNMALGQKYVQHLSDQPQIGDNLLMLLTAYNSGPGKLARWMNDDNVQKDPLTFIESLPVRETRDYVQQVLIHYWNYRARLSEPETSLTQLARGEWPRYALYDLKSVSKGIKQAQRDTVKLAAN